MEKMYRKFEKREENIKKVIRWSGRINKLERHSKIGTQRTPLIF
jgi:hypothetical protein